MINIILDTNIIITYPKLLGLNIPDTKFIVPIDVIAELNSRAQRRGNDFDSRVELIEKGEDEGTLMILNTDLPKFRKYSGEVNPARFAGADMSIVRAALVLSENEEVKIATLDRDIISIADQNNIEIIGKSEIEELLLQFKKPIDKRIQIKKFLEVLVEAVLKILPFYFIFEPFFREKVIDISSIQTKILRFERKETANLLAGILIGALCMLVAVLVYLNLGRIRDTINIWGTISVVLICGVFLFVIREKQRLIYGVFEFLVGVCSIILLFLNENFDYAQIDFNLDFSIKLLAGMYIMVRGQDNFVKSIRDTKLGVKLKGFGIGN